MLCAKTHRIILNVARKQNKTQPPSWERDPAEKSHQQSGAKNSTWLSAFRRGITMITQQNADWPVEEKTTEQTPLFVIIRLCILVTLFFESLVSLPVMVSLPSWLCLLVLVSAAVPGGGSLRVRAANRHPKSSHIRPQCRTYSRWRTLSPLLCSPTLLTQPGKGKGLKWEHTWGLLHLKRF